MHAFDRGHELMRRSLGRALVVRHCLGAASRPWRLASGHAAAQEADGRWWEAFPGFGVRTPAAPHLRRGAAAARRGHRRPAPRRHAVAQRSHDRGAGRGHPALSAHRHQRRLAGHSRLAHDPPRGQRRAHAAAAPAADDRAASWRAGQADGFGFGYRRPRGRPCAGSSSTTGCASPAASTSPRCRR